MGERARATTFDCAARATWETSPPGRPRRWHYIARTPGPVTIPPGEVVRLTIPAAPSGEDTAALAAVLGTRLREVTLRDGDFPRSFLEELGRFRGIEKLTFRGVEKADIKPGSFRGLTGLKHLVIEFQSDPLGPLCAEFRHLVGVKNLELEFVTIDEPLAKGLAAMPAVVAARFWGMQTTDRAFRSLCNLTNLKSVLFCEDSSTPTPITDAGFRHIRNLGKLRSLQLQGFEHVSPRGWEVLRELKHLRSLMIFSNPPFDFMEQVGPLPRVVDLELTHCNALTSAGWAVLAGMRSLRTFTASTWVARPYHPPFAELARMTRLRSLTLRDFRKTTDDDLMMLAPLRHLERFALTDAPRVTDAGLRVLRGFRQLHSVNLTGLPKLTDAGVAELAALPNLRELRLRCTNRVTDAGFAALAGARKLASLTLMYARNLTGERLLALAQKLPLVELEVYESPHITDEVMQQLAAIRRLQTVTCFQCKNVSDAGRAAFAASRA